MHVLVCGLGYVGAVTAASLLDDGHRVTGYDANPAVLSIFAEARSPIHEPGVDAALARGRVRLAASQDLAETTEADLAFVCVSSDATPDGRLDTSAIVAAATAIGTALRARPAERGPLIVVLRSTVLPGTTASVFAPALAEAAGEGHGRLYEIAYNPEFTREGMAMADFRQPSRIVVGGNELAASRVAEVYRGLDAPLHLVDYATAESIKLFDNAFHALKVTFANELGRYSAATGIDGARLAEIFVTDTKLNISPAYLRPGLPYGGPCLPKDTQALATAMRIAGTSAPLIDGVLASNEAHYRHLVAAIRHKAGVGARILLVGATPKVDTADLRGSPLVELARQLLAERFELSIYDPDAIEPLPGALEQARLRTLPPTASWDLVLVGRDIGAMPPGIPAMRLDVR